MVGYPGIIGRLVLCALPGLLFLVSSVQAGNKEMVEKDVLELDELNKSVVLSLPDLPAHGEVEIEADIRYREGKPDIEILRKKIRAINKPHARNGTGENNKLETRKESGLIKEGKNYEVEQ